MPSMVFDDDEVKNAIARSMDFSVDEALGSDPMDRTLALADPQVVNAEPMIFSGERAQPQAGPLTPVSPVFAKQPQPMFDASAPREPEDDGISLNFARGLAGFAGGVGAVSNYDKERQERREAPNKLRMQQMQMEDQIADRQTKRQELVDAMNPGSEASKSAQASFAALNKARAQLLIDRNPRLAQMFAQAAATAGGKSKLQLANAEKNYAQVMGEFGKMLDADARRALASEGMDLKRQGVQAAQDNAAATRALRRDQLGETTRHNKAMESAAANKLEAKVEGNQEKLNEKIEGWSNAEELLQQAAEAKKNVDVGPIATPINKLRQYTPWPNKYFDQLQQSLGSVRNEIKLLKAGKAVTANEEKGLNEELANLEQMQDDPTFEAKLQGMMKRIAGYKKRSVNQYQRKAGGETVDRSNTAREATGQPPSLTPAEQSGGGEAAKAKAWLQANPNDPRAEKVRAKLKEMGAL